MHAVFFYVRYGVSCRNLEETMAERGVDLYRAIDKFGKTLDFMLFERRNKAGIKAINKMLKGFGCPLPIEMVRRKFLNNVIEQDHRFTKRRI